MSTSLSQVEHFRALVEGLQEHLHATERFTLGYAA